MDGIEWYDRNSTLKSLGHTGCEEARKTFTTKRIAITMALMSASFCNTISSSSLDQSLTLNLAIPHSNNQYHISHAFSGHSHSRNFSNLKISSGAKTTIIPLQKHKSFVQVHAAKKNYSSFDEMLQTSFDQPILVDFYATWCGPCQFMVPVLEEVGKRLKDKIRVVKIDTEKYPNIASRYTVQALPTFILFKDGEPFHRLEGAIPADELTQRIEELLQLA